MTKPRIGRPPRAKKTATGRVELRATADEIKRWNAAAARAGVTLSEWIRAAVAVALR